jgi:hypothetical protein
MTTKVNSSIVYERFLLGIMTRFDMLSAMLNVRLSRMGMDRSEIEDELFRSWYVVPKYIRRNHEDCPNRDCIHPSIYLHRDCDC